MISKNQNNLNPPVAFMIRHGSKMMALMFWLTVIACYWWIAHQYNLSPQMMIEQLADWFANSFLGPLLFILFFILQPLVLFPSALMAITAGCLYGPTVGFFVTVIGANGAGLTSYFAGRFFGQDVSKNLGNRYVEYLRRNGFEALLVMHLIFLPYDVVNFMAGFVRVDFRSFVLGTALGSLPGTLTLVLFGASLQIDQMTSKPEINFSTLALSGLTMIVSVGLSQYLKRRV